jgi:capsular polysaccharide biosynthesis protein
MGQLIIHRELPVNIKDKDLELFQHELNYSLPENQVLELKHVYLDAQGTFISPSRLTQEVEEKNPIYQPGRIPLLKLLLKRLISGKLIPVNSPVFWVTDSWSIGYFHWMLDALPRLFLLKYGLPEIAGSICLPQSYANQEYVRESLKALGFVNPCFMKTNFLYRVRKMYFQSHIAATGNYDDRIIKALRVHLWRELDVREEAPGRRLYVSRNKTGRRILENEDDTFNLLKKYGFEMVHPEELSWLEQARLYASAECLTGIHGAGLSNMLFMQEQTRVLEFRMKSDRHNNCYFSLASALSIRYYYLQCNTSAREVLDADFTVNLDDLDSTLNNMLNE